MCHKRNGMYDFENAVWYRQRDSALIFYSYLNEKEDDFLYENNFGREEIKLGLKDITTKFGYEAIADVFSE